MAALRRDRRLRVGTPVDVAYERGAPGDFSYERGPCRHVGCLIRGGIFLRERYHRGRRFFTSEYILVCFFHYETTSLINPIGGHTDAPTLLSWLENYKSRRTYT